MPHGITARLVVALALVAGGSSGAAAWGWWERCAYGDYTCYGPPYGNTEPPDLYVYDHRTGPTWTGNGWAYLPVGRYRPRPPEYVVPPPPPAPAYRDDDDYDAMPPPHGSPRHRPMK